MRTRNKYAAMTVQGGYADGESPCAPCARTLSECPSCRLSDHTPVWDMGLRGEAEIVGVGDTGIDVDSCFFWDSSSNSAHPGPAFAPQTSSTHRKFVSYKAGGGGGGTGGTGGVGGGGDARDELGGHGTHVAASIAGAVDPAFQAGGDVVEHGGMAPAAKLAFFDLEKGDSGLDVPDDLEVEYYQWAYDLGARVHSNSWGDDSNDYTLMTSGALCTGFTGANAQRLSALEVLRLLAVLVQKCTY